MTATDIEFREIQEYDRFFELLLSGIGPINAGIEVGWTPGKVTTLLKDRDFAELVDVTRTRKAELLEEVVYRKAMAGNESLLKLYLFCHASDRGWRPPTQRHDHVGTIRHQQVSIDARAMVQHMIEEGNVADLQPIIDADIVDE